MRGDGFLWLLLLFIAGGVGVLVAQHGEGQVFGLSLDQFGSLVAKVALISVVGAVAWRMFAGRAGDAVRSALIWLVIIGALAVGYAYRGELRPITDRVLSEMVPGYVVSTGTNTVEVARGSGGFVVNAKVNGAAATLVLDTGASAVVLTQDDARAAGIALDNLRYDVTVETANGRSRAAAVRLRTLSIGTIEERDVSALVSPPGLLRTSLLGMTFLSRLQGFEIVGDRLILRGPAR